MSAALMAVPSSEASPRFQASVAGIFCLVNMLAFVPRAFVHARFIVDASTAATAADTLAHEPIFRLGFTSDFIAVASCVAVTALFVSLFRPVSRRVSILAAVFSLTGCAIGALSWLLLLVPLAALRAARLLPLEPFALLFLELRSQTANIAIVCFGFYCLLIGYLIIRSTFLPRALGVLMAIAGLGWLTYLFPSLARDLSPFNSLISGFVGEGSLALWLLVVGVNVRRWSAAALAVPEET